MSTKQTWTATYSEKRNSAKNLATLKLAVIKAKNGELKLKDYNAVKKEVLDETSIELGLPSIKGCIDNFQRHSKVDKRYKTGVYAKKSDTFKAKQAAKTGITLFSTMASICCMGIGLTPLNIGEISYVSMQAILNQYQMKEKYEIDIDSLLAGADSKKIKPKYWIRNSEE